MAPSPPNGSGSAVRRRKPRASPGTARTTAEFPAAAIAAVAVAHTRTKARRWRELALGSPVVPSGFPRRYTQENAGYGQKEEKNFAYQNLTDDTLGTSEYLAWPLGPTITITMTHDWQSIILTSLFFLQDEDLTAKRVSLPLQYLIVRIAARIVARRHRGWQGRRRGSLVEIVPLLPTEVITLH